MPLSPAGQTACIPVVTVAGAPYQVGLAIGRQLAPRLGRRVDEALRRRREAGINERIASRAAQPFLSVAEATFPDLVAELAGMADGGAVPFLELFRLNCTGARLPGESPWWRRDRTANPTERSPLATAAGGGCTSVISRGPDGVVVGHTEDYSRQARNDLYVLRVTNSRTTFCALNYVQTLAGCAAAINGAGLVQVIDSLHDPRHCVGVSPYFLARAALDQPDIDAAVALFRATPRDGGFNHLLVQGQRVVNVEGAANRLSVTEVDTATYAHTNHYRSEALGGMASTPAPNSLARLARARALLRADMTISDMYAVLADRVAYPDSICRDATIGAFVADTRQASVQIAWGQPDAAGTTFHGYDAPPMPA